MTRELPSRRVMLAHVKIINVVEGTCAVLTADGAHPLTEGCSLALGPGRWCRLVPQTPVRLWVIHAEEAFWRAQMSWFLPERCRVRPGLHPAEWNGAAITVRSEIATLRKIEPLWREMSILCTEHLAPEILSTRMIELLARWANEALPALIAPSALRTAPPPWRPINGALTDPAMRGHVGYAMQLLRERMREPWTGNSLAQELRLSRSQLHRLFQAHAGAPPMRFLGEIRLTAFARLIDETTDSVAHAATTVGWTDPRVASTWFLRRYGVTPTQYRRRPMSAASD